MSDPVLLELPVPAASRPFGDLVTSDPSSSLRHVSWIKPADSSRPLVLTAAVDVNGDPDAAVRTIAGHPAARQGCVCVRRHAPEPQQLHWHHIWPLGKGGPTVVANLVPLCPSAHANLHVLLDAYLRIGPLDWEIREHFNQYTRLLAYCGKQAVEQRRVPDLYASASLMGYGGQLPLLKPGTP